MMKETTQELAGTNAGFTYKESIKENQAVNLQKIGVSIFITFIIPFIAIFFFSASVLKHNNEQYDNEQRCYKTCSIKIVESVPDNVTFCNATLPPSTFYAWRRLIEVSKKELYITAYKSSLQGKHVLGQLSHQFSREGDFVYNTLLRIGKAGNVKIRMVENYPPKDKGDNADGIILQNYGAVQRRSIDIGRVLGRGKMHSKFLLSDNKHFYLGSANLDWRSLNQKMELGVLIEDCSCLGEDLKKIFEIYWKVPTGSYRTALDKKASYNMQRPLKIQIEGEESEIYLATSPKELNNIQRTWDLDAIVGEIDRARQFLDIHVMDYFPLFIYRKPKTHFPTIDDALRRAIVRGVRVRILAAALHYPQIGTRFLRSLQSLSEMNENTTVEVKIFKVPTINAENIVISRERRTHNKFMVSETAVIIGTSNWSGDYFIGGTTGAAIVVKQYGKKKAMIREMQDIFHRDWTSEYAHPLEDYFVHCVETFSADFCEGEKDPSLFASPQNVD